MTKMTLEDYLGEKGLSFIISDFMLDKLKIPHGLSLRQRKKLERDNMKYANNYAEKRQQAIDEYNLKVKNGEIIPPTSNELLIRRANGHPDNESTQAARRLCKKRKISWEINDG